MSSLITKLNKGRSTSSQKSHAQKTRKATSKKQPQKKRIAVPKSKKVNLTQSAKKSASARTVKAVKAVKAVPRPAKAKSAKAKLAKAKAVSTKPVKAVAAKPANGRTKLAGKKLSHRAGAAGSKEKFTKATAGRTTVVRRSQRSRPAPKVELEVKKPPSPKTVAGIRAFENALKSFNRQDFSTAKTSFEVILTQFSDQTDIVSPVRTYLAICDQKLAKSAAPTRGLEPLYNQGVFEFNRGNTELAISTFEKALKLEPRADHVLYSLATAYAKAGITNKALESLRRAIALSPVHRSHSRHDQDFAMLRDNPDFQRLSGLDMEFS